MEVASGPQVGGPRPRIYQDLELEISVDLGAKAANLQPRPHPQASGDVVDGVKEARVEKDEEERLGDLGQGCSFRYHIPKTTLSYRVDFLFFSCCDGFDRSPDEGIAVVEAGGREVEWVGAGAIGPERRGS
ncbi:hypothetical protein CRG98_017998 [Punica granatum]|nr:hypothetical protein CRG98_017998 [Punica granatum]